MLGGISPSSTQRAGALPVCRRSRPLARSLHALANCKALSLHQQSHNFARACHSTPPGTKFDSAPQHIVPGIVHCRLVPGHTGGNASVVFWNRFCRRYIRRGGHVSAISSPSIVGSVLRCCGRTGLRGRVLAPLLVLNHASQVHCTHVTTSLWCQCTVCSGDLHRLVLQ